MSQGDPIAIGPVAPCHTCRHTAYYGSCPECGGGKGYPAPPAVPMVGPCQGCRLKIADEPPPLTPVEQVMATADQQADPEAPTEIMQRPDVIADLTPLPETWRNLLTELAIEARDLAERDEAKAAWALRQCRDVFARLRMMGS